MLAKAVELSVVRFESLGDAENPDLAEVEKELRAKRVNYYSEKKWVCTPLTLKQVVPALPPKDHGGAIDILRLVSQVTRQLLLHPERLVVEDIGQEFPKMRGKVHVKPGELDGIADELVERGICKWIPITEVAKFRGEYVLNGLFGVPKSAMADDGSPAPRLIINLVPGNSIRSRNKFGVKSWGCRISHPGCRHSWKKKADRSLLGVGYVFQFRRPGMAFLETVWKVITQPGFDQQLSFQAKRELWNCVLAIPTLISFLGAKVTDVITASDASNRGGAVGLSRSLLTEPGTNFVRLTIDPAKPKP